MIDGIMDWSPFAIFASLPVLLIYSGLTIYLAACMVLAYKVTRSYADNDNWCCYQHCCIPKWIIWIITFVCLTAVFAVVILPGVFCMSAWVFVIEKIRRRYLRWRKRGDANDVEAGRGTGAAAAANDDAGSWTTIDSPVSPTPRNNQVGLHTPMGGGCLAEPYLEPPEPVYLQGRVYQDTLRG